MSTATDDLVRTFKIKSHIDKSLIKEIECHPSNLSKIAEPLAPCSVYMDVNGGYIYFGFMDHLKNDQGEIIGPLELHSIFEVILKLEKEDNDFNNDKWIHPLGRGPVDGLPF